MSTRGVFVLRVLLVVSLTGNMVLGVLTYFSRGTTERVVSKATAEEIVKTPQANREALRSSQVKLWDQLRTDNLAELGRRLEQAGFPRNYAIPILKELIIRRFRARSDALLGKPSERKYWKPEYAVAPAQKKEAEQMREEVFEMLKNVCGEKWYMSDEDLALERFTRFGMLTDEKAATVDAIKSKYLDEQRALHKSSTGAGGYLTSEERKRELELEVKQRAELAGVLTKEELFEYDLRNSPIAERLKRSTGFFHPSESEFRALFAAYQDVADQATHAVVKTDGSFDFVDVDQRIKDLSLEAAKDVLTPQRYAEFLQARDPASEKLNLIVQRQNLPISAAVTVTQAEKEITASLEAIRTNPSLSPEVRATQVQSLLAEANRRIEAVLGGQGFAAYKYYSGKWLEAKETTKQ